MILVFFISTSVAATPTVSPALRPAGLTPSLNPRPPYAISGRLSLIATNLVQAGSACTGQGQYADIQAGAPVTITDSTGGVIGVSHLGTGHRRLTADVAAGGTCDFEFVVGGNPGGGGLWHPLRAPRDPQVLARGDQQQRWTVRVELRTD